MGPPESVQTIFSQHTQQICETFKFFALLITAVAFPRLVLCHPQNGGKFKFCLACLRLNFKFREKFLPGQPEPTVWVTQNSNSGRSDYSNNLL